jgi:hypothetical protein
MYLPRRREEAGKQFEGVCLAGVQRWNCAHAPYSFRIIVSGNSQREEDFVLPTRPRFDCSAVCDHCNRRVTIKFFAATITKINIYRKTECSVQKSRTNQWFQASAAMLMRSALFWGITQRRVVILYRRFGTTYRSRLGLLDPWRWDRCVVPKRR